MLVLRMIRALSTLGRGLLTGLPAPTADKDPVELFKEWFAAAERAGLLLPESMTVATVSASGRPSARTILLKHVDQQGFVFYTNYESRKGRELDLNPYVSLVFHWHLLQRQVRVEGRAERATAEESLAYFRSRPRGSQIGAWASRQSQELESEGELEDRIQEFERRFKGQEIPLPPYWGGIRVVAERIEFWQGRPYRLHDRLLFERTEDGWRHRRLYP